MMQYVIQACCVVMAAMTGCHAAEVDCWPSVLDSFDSFTREFNRYDWVAIDWSDSKVEAARSKLRSSAYECLDEKRFRISQPEIPGEAIYAITLLDVAIVSNDSRLTGSMMARFEDELSQGNDVVGLASLGSSLHLAASFESDEAAHTLLQLGVDPNAQDDYGFMPLHAASGRGQSGLRLITALVRSGADVNELGPGVTPIELARRTGDLNRAQCLFLLGATIPEMSPPPRYPAPFREDQGELIIQVDAFLSAEVKEIPESTSGICSLP
ncbi:ankyrin repeat domain-containing protein [Eudoraea sp.]|uniref:ankyrin repeat domain-containing protein n=1 Tax=Eudoraea sp. TaxID=1979955 RepID=UPI003C75528B